MPRPITSSATSGASAISAAYGGPVRVRLYRYGQPQDNMTVLLNPQTWRTQYAAEWPRQPALGLAYEPVQYSRTRNPEHRGTFHVSAFEAQRQFYAEGVGASPAERVSRARGGVGAFGGASNLNAYDYPDRFRRFLASFLYPIATPVLSERFQEPPWLVFSWPRLLTFVGVLEEISFDYQRMASDGTPLIYTAECKFVEVATERTLNALRDLGFSGGAL